MRGATSGNLSGAGAGVGIEGAGLLLGWAATMGMVMFGPLAGVRWQAMHNAPSKAATAQPEINHESTRSSTKLLDERDANLFPTCSCDFVS